MPLAQHSSARKLKSQNASLVVSPSVAIPKLLPAACAATAEKIQPTLHTLGGLRRSSVLLRVFKHHLVSPCFFYLKFIAGNYYTKCQIGSQGLFHVGATWNSKPVS